MRVESSAPIHPPLHGNGALRVQPDSLADDDDHAGTPHRLDPLVLLYPFLAFLLGAALQSSESFANCQHLNSFPRLGVAALQGYPLLQQALIGTNLPLGRIPGLRHQDPSVGVGQLAYAGIHSMASGDFPQAGVEASLLEVLLPHS